MHSRSVRYCPTTHLTPRRGLHTLRTYLRHDGNLVSCSSSANGVEVHLRVTGSVTGRVRAHVSGSGGLSDRFRFLYINRFLGSQFFKPASSNHSSHSPSPLVPCPLVSWSLSLLQRLPKVRCWGHHSHSHSQRPPCDVLGDLARDRAHKSTGVACCLLSVRGFRRRSGIYFNRNP